MGVAVGVGDTVISGVTSAVVSGVNSGVISGVTSAVSPGVKVSGNSVNSVGNSVSVAIATIDSEGSSAGLFLPDWIAVTKMVPASATEIIGMNADFFIIAASFD